VNQTDLPPQLPAPWLDQIKEASKAGAKTSAWALIAGSSVLAALIGAGANFLLESRRASVELEKARVAQVRQTLKSLSADIGKIDQALDLLVATGKVALQDPTNKKLSFYTAKSIGQVGDLMGELFSHAQDTAIDQDLRRELNDILDELGPNLERVRGDLHALPELGTSHDTDLSPRLKKLQAALALSAENVKVSF